MIDKEKVYDFAIKWREKFRDPNIDYMELIDWSMSEDCETIGFVMDIFESFIKEYGKKATNYDGLKAIIDSVNDIKSLGSGVFSMWRYYNHWACDSEVILEPLNRAWFILALDRLAYLSRVNDVCFEQAPTHINIVSNKGAFLTFETDDENEQQLLIHDDGRVYFTSYCLDNQEGLQKQKRNIKTTIERDIAKRIIKTVSEHLKHMLIEVLVLDVGTWDVEINYGKALKSHFRGSLYEGVDADLVELSNFIRREICIDDLFVFDGNESIDKVDRVEIEYHKMKVDEGPNAQESLAWNYEEKLIVDRETESIKHTQKRDLGSVSLHTLQIPGKIVELLDGLDAEHLFELKQEDLSEVIHPSNEMRKYTIIVDFEQAEQKKVTGDYHKSGLPKDWLYFVERVVELMQCYGKGEMLQPSVYSFVKRRIDEHIFCSVVFEGNNKSYYYLTDDESIEVGDLVLVPSWNDEHLVVVEVVGVEYYHKANAPFPIDEMKKIIGKYVVEDSLNHELT